MWGCAVRWTGMKLPEKPASSMQAKKYLTMSCPRRQYFIALSNLYYFIPGTAAQHTINRPAPYLTIFPAVLFNQYQPCSLCTIKTLIYFTNSERISNHSIQESLDCNEG